MKTLFLILESFRPRQWTKNLIIFAGILFSQNITDLRMLAVTAAAFLVFCLLSGAVYTINDIVDAEEDKKHPLKSKRPVASGRLNKNAALAISLMIAAASLTASFFFGPVFLLISAGYLLLQLAYSFYLKQLVIIDVFAIALGFVLRVVAGAVAIDVEISSWFVICTILLSLFLGFSKRRHELETLEDNAKKHRKVLNDYSQYLLDQMISVVTASTVIAYALYTIAPETVEKFGTNNLIFTVPFVLYGIFRYLYLVHQKGEGGSPENILVSDVPLIIDILLWAATAAAILYF
ncbi:MAG: decaprenyl-phosphate phosphoribosyltransferase [Elusimicrobiota bacterium]